MVVPDYNLLTPDVIDNLLDRPIEKALGSREIERVNKIQTNYDYYHGKQHFDKDMQVYRYATDINDWDGKDYEPTRYWTNYFKAFIKRKSRWQMAGNHGLTVVPDGESDEAIATAKDTEALLAQLWKDNDMNSQKMQLARDRMIAGSIACKLSFNPRTGKLHWIWHRATEVFPIYSKDGFDDLIGCDIIIAQEEDEDPDRTQYRVQAYRLENDDTECWFSEKLYNQELEVVETFQEYSPLGVDFIPVIMFNIKSLATESGHFQDTEDLRILQQIINEMMEDASDSLKFEMFSMVAIKNADLSENEDMPIAPGATLKINSATSSHPADVETVESSFQWNETFRAQYNRVKSAMHELQGIPQITPSELNFGGMNDRALQVLYQEIIQETQEQWLLWDRDFAELFQKSVWYLKARQTSPKFKYDKSTLGKIDEIETEVNFVLPLPDDRLDLVELIEKEIEGGLESRKGGLRRLGVKSPDDKLEEIYSEIRRDLQERDPYGESNSYADVEAFRPVEDEGTSTVNEV